jgi:serine/threonine-protein kinase
MRATAGAGAGSVVDTELPERYQLVRQIARGGMASVWCAYDFALARRVAIKLLAERYAHDQAAARRFKREARAAAALSGHPHVVTIFDVGETARSERVPAGRAFIVMEHLPGGSVADAASLRTVTRADAIRWLLEAASALDYAHARGVLHRDIKLANLLLDHARALHVADFGIAQIGTEDTITGAGEVLGTAAYLAPERALGHPATEASDRYSFAVAAFELLVGARPFAAESFTVLARQHVEQQPPAASEHNRMLPPAVDAVLVRGMAKAPEDRWPSAAAFADELKRALTGPVIARSRAAGGGPPAPAPTAASATGARPAVAATNAVDAEAVAPRKSPHAIRGRPVTAIALATLAAAAIAVGAAAISSMEGRREPHRTAQVHRRSAPRRAATRRHPVAAKPRPRSVPATTRSRTSAAVTVPPASADTLQARAHQLILAGDYASAIPLLRRAVTTASPGSLTYAYALFDLGRSLRLAGNPRDAATILWRRLQIPDQTPTVRHELQLALLAIGSREHASKPKPAPAPPAPRSARRGRD